MDGFTAARQSATDNEQCKAENNGKIKNLSYN